jgi:hypothetical protein
MHVQRVDPVNNSSECAGSAACHGAELVFEWDNAAAYNISFTPDEQSLAEALAAVLRQLAAQRSISWPRFDPKTAAFTLIQVSHPSPPLPSPPLSPSRCTPGSLSRRAPPDRRQRPSLRATRAPQSARCGRPRLRGMLRALCYSNYFTRPVCEAAVRHVDRRAPAQATTVSTAKIA